jgi:hypothetical protein
MREKNLLQVLIGGQKEKWVFFNNIKN